MGRHAGNQGGRPPGRKNDKTLTREAAKEAARERLRELLTEKMEPVAEALVSRATGVRYFVTRNAKTGKFEIVTDPKAVAAALNSEDGFSGEFYTDKPETAAIKEFFDRTVDKAKEQEQEIRMDASGDLLALLLDGRKRAAEGK